ncbi:MFS transporter [Oceanivirga salmonicida]|uniref:MFS transporter n=1 Tax=Oceanivirga salmonicida TaxID=1769291 RepID=UPI0008352D88|nr:MFS transporter [Oceanivirga salmonicida]
MTKKFAVLQFIYWFLFCTAYSFANPVLSSKGFSVSNIGIILSLSAFLSVITQPLLAKLINKYNRISNRLILIFSMISLLLMLILSIVIKNNIVLTIIYILILSNILNTQTFIYTFIFDYINNGYEINFGLTRGTGSIAFAIASLGLGYITKFYGFSFIIYLELLLTVLIIFMIFSFNSNDIVKEVKLNKEYKGNIFTFVKKYKKFTWFLLGIMCIFTTHMAINNFFLNIMQSVGKGTMFVGIGLAIAAILELPVMASYKHIKRKFGSYNILFFAIISFTIKSFIVLIGLMFNSVSIILLSQVSQIFAFAIYLPTAIHYVNDVMEKEDRVKGQAYLGSAGTISSIIASYIGARIIENQGVTYMVLFITVISLVGTVIVCKNLERIKNEKNT